jgi:pilus assembly protein Flp/PilA
MNQLLNMIAFIAARLQVARTDAKDRGATATEYAMLVAFIAVAIAAAVTLFGTALKTFFGTISSAIGLG